MIDLIMPSLSLHRLRSTVAVRVNPLDSMIALDYTIVILSIEFWVQILFGLSIFILSYSELIQFRSLYNISRDLLHERLTRTDGPSCLMSIIRVGCIRTAASPNMADHEPLWSE
jgi:hypothetical protein